MLPDRRFLDFGNRLAESGLGRQDAARLALELHEHFEDLRADLLASGYDGEEARILATRELGALDDIARIAVAQKELLCWSARYPLLAASGPLLVAATTNAGKLARWGVIFASSGTITALTLLFLQLAITRT